MLRFSLYRIWEGTTTVLALDLVRSAQDPLVVDSFVSVSFWLPELCTFCLTR